MVDSFSFIKQAPELDRERDKESFPTLHKTLQDDKLG